MNRKSNEIWKNESNYINWELRKYRFTDEMRPVYFQCRIEYCCDRESYLR